MGMKDVLILFSGLLLSLVAAEFLAWGPTISQRLLDLAVYIAPARHRERIREEWQRELDDLPGPIAKMGAGLGFVVFASGQPASRGQDAALRAMDLIVASCALLMLIPASLTIATLVRLDSPGPIMVRQRRTGRDGRVFRLLKFRTFSLAEQDGERQVTRIGEFLRSSSLDSMPQLINVLLGHMSLVGPRPHSLAHDATYSELLPTYVQRFAVRPGLTGLAQISEFCRGPDKVKLIAERLEADVAYVKSRSLVSALVILMRTIPVMLRKVNRY